MYYIVNLLSGWEDTDRGLSWQQQFIAYATEEEVAAGEVPLRVAVEDGTRYDITGYFESSTIYGVGIPPPGIGTDRSRRVICSWPLQGPWPIMNPAPPPPSTGSDVDTSDPDSWGSSGEDSSGSGSGGGTGTD